MIKKLICLSVLCVGCNPPTPAVSPWKITLINPQGETQKEWEVMSIKKPTIGTAWGGQLQALDRGHSGYWAWEREVIAPVGWFLEVSEVENK